MIKYISLLTVGALLLAGCAGPDATSPDSTATGTSDNGAPVAEDKSAPVDVTFKLTGENFRFIMDGEEAPELRVQQGDRVRIDFVSTSGFHDWVVDEFSASTAKVQTGEMTSVEFVASETGTFEYYCSVGNHREQGMVGNLVVE